MLFREKLAGVELIKIPLLEKKKENHGCLKKMQNKETFFEIEKSQNKSIEIETWFKQIRFDIKKLKFIKSERTLDKNLKCMGKQRAFITSGSTFTKSTENSFKLKDLCELSFFRYCEIWIGKFVLKQQQNRNRMKEKQTKELRQ